MLFTLLSLVFGSVQLAVMPARPHAPDTTQYATAATSSAFNLRPARRRDALPSWTLPPFTNRHTKVWVNLGYAVIDKAYDERGDTQAFVDHLRSPVRDPATGLLYDLDADGFSDFFDTRIIGELQVINVHAGFSYDIIKQPTYDLTLGLDLAFSQHTLKADEITSLLPESVGGPTTAPINLEIDSGFKAQNVSIFTEVKHRYLSGRLGFFYDLGPGRTQVLNERTSTDRQHAVLLGASGTYPAGPLRVFGGASAYLSLEGEESNATFDEGNVYALHAGAGYAFSVAEVGLGLTYRTRTDGTRLIFSPTGRLVDEARAGGYQVGLAPYLNLMPSPVVTIYLKGALQDEYRDYSFSLTGENDWAPEVGLTVGLVYVWL